MLQGNFTVGQYDLQGFAGPVVLRAGGAFRNANHLGNFSVVVASEEE